MRSDIAARAAIRPPDAARPKTNQRQKADQSEEDETRKRISQRKTRLVTVQLHAQQLPTNEHIIPMRERSLRLDPHVGAVAAFPVGEHELAFFFFDGAVLAGQEDVAREVEVAVFATDLQRRAAGADSHADGAAF